MVGFDARNKSTINTLYICRSCDLILRDPFQLSCGHRQCKSCIDAIDGEMIKCVECQEETAKNEIMPDRGFKNDMKQLPITCLLCDSTGSFKDYEKHLNQEHSNLVCELCSDKFNSIIRLDEHKQKECTKITITGALEESDCCDSVGPVQLQEHYSINIHQKAIITDVSCSSVITTTEQHQEVSEMDVVMGQTTVSDTTTATATNANENINAQLQEVHETIDILVGGIQTLNDDIQRLSGESSRIQSIIGSITQDLAPLMLSNQEQSAFLSSIRYNQETLQQEVASLKQKVDDLQYVCYDGTLIWKIPSFREKMVDAQSERQTSIYSPPFYSSPTGYKMRARLYLHGDGNARRTHMSLFFVLMRGTNDAILKFPFNYKVSFCMFDQTPDQRHVIDSFRPDIRSSSFQRPRSEMNIASGIPKFFSLAMIQQDGNPYVRDDTMFIKVLVDFGDIHKTLLPYALSLNPGFPTYVQQIMIKQEADRRDEQRTSSAATPNN